MEKIYRSNKEYIIAGVCGGLAQHFEVDPTIVRIIFIILSFGAGSGILIYIVLWLFLPTNSDRKIKENSEEIKSNYQNMGYGSNFFGIIILLVGIGGLLGWKIFWPVILVLLGLYLIFKKR